MQEIQYCFAHLLRDLQDIEKDFPDHAEVQAFVGSLAPLLASAMALRGLKLSKREFCKQAAVLSGKIRGVINRSARHPAIQSYQDIFRQKADRLYHWAKDPSVPAENNFAERELRPLVVARKVSFGSQSGQGAATREVLMSVLHTLRKRAPDPVAALRACLDQMAISPTFAVRGQNERKSLICRPAKAKVFTTSPTAPVRDRPAGSGRP